jgi:PAS domain S-box-containing protein
VTNPGPATRSRAFIFAAAAVLLAAALRLAANPWLGHSVPYLLYFPAIMLAAWFGGFWPGVLATVLSGLMASYWTIAPTHSLLIRDPGDRIAFLLFLAIGALIAQLHETVRRADRGLWQLAAIVHSSDDAIISKDLNGVVTSWNKGAERLFGYAADEAIGRSITLIIPPDRLSEEDRVLAQIRAGRRVEPFETVRQRKDGAAIDVWITVSPIMDGSGAVAGASKIARDITERRRIERLRDELIERERVASDDAMAARDRLQFLADVGVVLSSSLDYAETLDRAVHLALPRLGDYCTVLIEDDLGRLNHVASGHVVREKEPALRELILRVFEAPAAAGRLTFADAVMRTGKTRVVTHDEIEQATASMSPQLDPEIVALGMRLRPYAYVGVPLHLRGRVVGVMAFGTTEQESSREYTNADVVIVEAFADRASLAVENARLFRQADDLNRLKDEFLATLSHEMRTPLAAVLGWSRMLASGQLTPEKAAKAVEAIERNAQAQAKIVDDILDVARGMSGNLALDMQPVDLVSVAHRGVEAVTPAAAAKQVQVEVRAVAPVPVVGDPGRLQQVLWNLLSNAVKFTPPGGHVTVSAAIGDGHAELRVADTGVGIPAAFLPFVFDKFRQADGSLARQHGGLGLGLAIARHLVELHGGSIEALSAGEGTGATFIVRLPIPPSATTDIDDRGQTPTTEDQQRTTNRRTTTGERLTTNDQRPMTNDQ